MTLFDPMVTLIGEIEERIVATRDALVDADKEFDTTVALLVATTKDSQYFGLIGQLGTARPAQGTHLSH